MVAATSCMKPGIDAPVEDEAQETPTVKEAGRAEAEGPGDAPAENGEATPRLADTDADYRPPNEEQAVADIRKHFAEINETLTEYTRVFVKDVHVQEDTNPDAYSREASAVYRLAGTNLERYLDGDVPVKIIAKMDGDRQDLISEYYYRNGTLCFVLRRMVNYDDPKWGADFDEEKNRVVVNRFYFHRGRMVRWINGENAKVDPSDPAYIRAAADVMSDSALYMSMSREDG